MALDTAIEVRPFPAPLGAEIANIDIGAPLSARERDELLAAWHAHLVVVVRGKTIDDAQLIEFTRNLGEPQAATVSEIGRYGDVPPEITIVSNIKVRGKPIGSLGAGEADWHTDSSAEERPPDGSVLHALEIPESGGNTHFCNMYMAYDELPGDVKAQIAGKLAIHDAAYTSAGDLRHGQDAVTDVRDSPGARHPLVRIHPATRRKALFLGRRRNAYIVGMPVEESEELLDYLWAHATQDRFAWTHTWRAGDLLIWDNRCVMHRRDAFDPATRRLMHRAQVAASHPVEAG